MKTPLSTPENRRALQERKRRKTILEKMRCCTANENQKNQPNAIFYGIGDPCYETGLLIEFGIENDRVSHGLGDASGDQLNIRIEVQPNGASGRTGVKIGALKNNAASPTVGFFGWEHRHINAHRFVLVRSLKKLD